MDPQPTPRSGPAENINTGEDVVLDVAGGMSKSRADILEHFEKRKQQSTPRHLAYSHLFHLHWWLNNRQHITLPSCTVSRVENKYSGKVPDPAPSTQRL